MASIQSTARRTNSTTDYEAALEEIAERGAAAIKNTRSRAERVVSDATEKGEEALESARQVRDTVADTILRSVRARPYTTLALAAAIGFLYGAMRRR
jgi:ElaB/YqjD/DUF883 family membrane-anchored ribosome-binding protein